MRTRLAALAAIYLTAHLAFLSPTLEDIDSVNFALGVRHFDVAQHQPHPPGSPVFIALAKGSTAVLHAFGVRGAAARALAFWSAVSGALMFPLVFALFAALDGDRRRAFWTAVVAALAPLAWFTGSRPMSDFTGLALAVAAQGLIAAAWMGRAGWGSLVAGALLAGIAAGVRIQTAALTGPVLAAVLLAVPSVPLAARVRAAGAALAGVLLWLTPLILVSGGPTLYLSALGSQAGEDLVGVVMLWTTPTLRVAFHAFVNAFVWPWGTLALGVVVVAVAAIGLLHGAIRAPKDVVALALLFGSYALFHLLMQETLTMRYALPLVVPIAYLFVRGASALRLSPFAEIAVIVAGLVVTVPQTTAFAKGSPGFAALGDALERGGTLSGHAGMRRLWDWVDDRSGRAFLRAPHGYEWLTLVEEWRKNPDARVQFLANPKRTDHRTLIDPQARQASVDYRWPFVEWPHLGGARPGPVTRIEFAPPGWMLDRGWSVSAEVAGVTELDGYGPHRRPSVAWVRGRDAVATLMIGGRHLGSAADPQARMTLAVNGTTFDEWAVKPGFFFRTVDVPAGLLSGTGYLPLSIAALSVSPDPPVRVGLEQFDLQSSGVTMAGVADGWHEPEYDRSTGRAWRWASERAALWVRPVGRDVTLIIDAESPKRYFDSAPVLRVTIGGTELARLSPSEEFRWTPTLPAALLAAADGRVVLESDKWFVPGDRDGTGDRRHLALRVYSFSVK